MKTLPGIDQDMYLYTIEIKESPYNTNFFYQKMTDANTKIGFITTIPFEDVSFKVYLFFKTINIAYRNVKNKKYCSEIFKLYFF